MRKKNSSSSLTVSATVNVQVCPDRIDGINSSSFVISVEPTEQIWIKKCYIGLSILFVLKEHERKKMTGSYFYFDLSLSLYIPFSFSLCYAKMYQDNNPLENHPEKVPPPPPKDKGVRSKRNATLFK